MTPRRQHLRAWAVEVVREGLERGTFMRGWSVDTMFKWVLAQAALDLKADLKEIVAEIGLGLMDTGLKVAQRKTEQIVGGVFEMFAEKFKRK